MAQQHLPTNALDTVNPLDSEVLTLPDHTFPGLGVVALILTGGMLQWLGFAIAHPPMARAENPAHVQQLLQTNECLDCDLRNSYLSGLDLTDANLAGSQLRGANLTDTNLTRANLHQVNLSEAILTNTTLQGANLEQSSLRNARIVDFCSFETGLFSDSGDDVCVPLKLFLSVGSAICPDETTASEGFLELISDGRVTDFFNFCTEEFPTFALRRQFSNFFGEPTFQGTNLSNADLTGINLSGVNLSYADLSGAILTNANLNHAILLHATMDEVQGGDLTQAILSDQDMRNVLANLVVQQAIARREREAEELISTLNRYQQATYIEQSRFSRDMDEFMSFYYGEQPEDSEYQYAIRQVGDDFAIHVAEAQSEDLNDIVGLVLLQQVDTEPTTIAVMCKSEKPEILIPTSLTLPALDEPLDDANVACPAGFQKR